MIFTLRKPLFSIAEPALQRVVSSKYGEAQDGNHREAACLIKSSMEVVFAEQCAIS